MHWKTSELLCLLFGQHWSTSYPYIFLLNKAYNTMKEENHEWLQNIHFLQNKIGMADVWQSPRTCDKEHLKSSVMGCLQNMFIQKYDDWLYRNMIELYQ